MLKTIIYKHKGLGLEYNLVELINRKCQKADKNHVVITSSVSMHQYQ